MDDHRRRFCQLAGVAIAGTWVSSVLPGCGANGSSLMIVDTMMKTTDFAVGDAVLIQVPGFNAYVCHDVGGLYAMSANCTHARCIIQFNDPATGFQCNCHNSTFDYNGQNQTPPAPSPLQHYAVTVTMGEVFVDPNTPVPPETRTPAT